MPQVLSFHLTSSRNASFRRSFSKGEEMSSLDERSRERNFQKTERGVTAAEYIGIVSIMIVLLMAAFPAFSGAIGALLTSVIESFQNFSPSP